MQGQTDFLARSPNPYFGDFQASNIVEGTIVKVHTDEAMNVTMTADVVTIKNEMKTRVPFLFPYASSGGDAGVYAIPDVGDKCIVGLAAGNTPYILGYHPSPQVEPGRATASVGGPTLKGTFSKSQLLPGGIELRTKQGNRVMIHPGGPVLIESRTDLFSFYDAVLATLTHFTRSYELFTAGGSVSWKEGVEKAQRSMTYSAELFTKSATEENLDKDLRGGARMTVLFSEEANHFFIEVTDVNNITSRIQLGPNGVILTSSDGTNQGSIAVSPSGGFSLIAGDPSGVHSQVDLAPSAVAISAFIGPGTPAATVQATSDGAVNISSQQMVVIDAPLVNTQGGITGLGALGGLPVARVLDPVVVLGVEGGPSAANGFITGGSAVTTSA